MYWDCLTLSLYGLFPQQEFGGIQSGFTIPVRHRYFGKQSGYVTSGPIGMTGSNPNPSGLCIIVPSRVGFGSFGFLVRDFFVVFVVVVVVVVVVVGIGLGGSTGLNPKCILCPKMSFGLHL